MVITPPSQIRNLRIIKGQLPPRPSQYSMKLRGEIVRREVMQHIKKELVDLEKWQGSLKASLRNLIEGPALPSE